MSKEYKIPEIEPTIVYVLYGTCDWENCDAPAAVYTTKEAAIAAAKDVFGQHVMIASMELDPDKPRIGGEGDIEVVTRKFGL